MSGSYGVNVDAPGTYVLLKWSFVSYTPMQKDWYVKIESAFGMLYMCSMNNFIIMIQTFS